MIDGSNDTWITDVQTDTGAAGVAPWTLAVNPVTNKIWVGLQSTNNPLQVINGATNSITAIAGITGVVQAVAVNPVTNQVFAGPFALNLVKVIDGGTNTVTKSLAVTSGGAQTMGVNPVTGKVYVTNNSASGSVTVIDGAPMGYAPAPNPIATGAGPSFIAVNPVTHRIYVANNTGNNVTRIDGATRLALNIGSGLGHPSFLAINPATNMIYVQNPPNQVAVINGGTETIVANITVGAINLGTAETIAVNPVTNRI